ncbi:solute carrier organic anion transporter family member 1C1-like [Puntigrus tetrazona]|uniref:solute carrier organic anion transporter family member 1C1-like n=1 Tax=Puntigrus tetrazona TaxID=1606681 RepID=UPI001C8AF93D|nr:solute carrier organic anion transporter family member 1C1-like [Puntigrus tetrazona]
MSVEKKTTGEPCCSKLKMFLAALCFVYFAKAFQGSYMKSSITQIERRFDIPSSLIGFIDGSFEIGNLLVIAFVSYFGASLHRPRLIGAGCLIMAMGSFITALPRYFQGPYQYETTISYVSASNGTESILPCLTNGSPAKDEIPTVEIQEECEKNASSSLWLYVFLGNMLRGVGETPVVPLGLSYLDDFSRTENSALYMAVVQTVGIIGPVFGFMLGSFCAKLYVDIGAVDLDTITIDHKDSRWVGAWWLGFLVTGGLMLLAGIPFWFFPKSLPKKGETETEKKSNLVEGEQGRFIPENNKHNNAPDKPASVSMATLAKDFLPSLRKLFCNTIYMVLIIGTILQVNGFVGMMTFQPKYIEQTYGQSASRAIFLLGIFNLPAVALGIVTGGFVMKKFKLNILWTVKICFVASSLNFSMLLSQYFLQCDNSQVAGLTISYQGAPEVSYQQNTLISPCNMGCTCSLKHWDPICGNNGLTYASPCLAGCRTSTGVGKEIVFHNCTCVGDSPLPYANMSAVLGQCPRKSDCDSMFKLYMAVTVLGSFFVACTVTPGYIILLRSINPELKSLALGLHILLIRTLGGIPAAIYFGALIDMTCLKWGTKQCGGRGACRIYDSIAFRNYFLGVIYALFASSYVLCGVLYNRLAHRERKQALQSQLKAHISSNGRTAILAMIAEQDPWESGTGMVLLAVNEERERLRWPGLQSGRRLVGFQIREAVTPYHTSPGITVIAHVGIEVSQKYNRVPRPSSTPHNDPKHISTSYNFDVMYLGRKG